MELLVSDFNQFFLVVVESDAGCAIPRASALHFFGLFFFFLLEYSCRHLLMKCACILLRSSRYACRFEVVWCVGEVLELLAGEKVNSMNVRSLRSAKSRDRARRGERSRERARRVRSCGAKAKGSGPKVGAWNDKIAQTLERGAARTSVARA